MALAFVQNGDNGNTASGTSANPLPSTATAGNTVLVGVGSGTTPTSVSSGMGSFTQLSTQASGAGSFTWYGCSNVAAARSFTATGGGSWWSYAVEISGTVFQMLGGVTNTGTSASPAGSQSGIAAGAFYVVGLVTASSITGNPASPWTAYNNATDNWGTGQFLGAAWQFPAAGTISATWTTGASASYAISGAMVLPPSFIAAPTPLQTRWQAVSRASMRMARSASGLFTPDHERLITPRTALET